MCLNVFLIDLSYEMYFKAVLVNRWFKNTVLMLGAMC